MTNHWIDCNADHCVLDRVNLGPVQNLPTVQNPWLGGNTRRSAGHRRGRHGGRGGPGGGPRDAAADLALVAAPGSAVEVGARILRRSCRLKIRVVWDTDGHNRCVHDKAGGNSDQSWMAIGSAMFGREPERVRCTNLRYRCN